MPPLDNLSKYWLTIQNSLFPWLEEELGELSTNERKLVTTLELVRLEAFLLNWAGVTGRPPADRVALAILCGAGHNIRKLLRAFLFFLFRWLFKTRFQPVNA